MRKKREVESESTRVINNKLIDIFTKLFANYMQHARSEHFPQPILDQLEADFQTALDERRRLFADTKREFRLTDYYAQRPNNLWLHIERELMDEIKAFVDDDKQRGGNKRNYH